MKVPIVDLGPQHQALRPKLMAAFERILDSQKFVLGAEVEEFEKEVALYCETPFAIGCASGSDALLLALMALDITEGDEVITSPFTFFATGSAISRLGARPVFADINPHTFTIDPAQAEAAITPRTRAIIPVHLYGQCAEMDALLEICKRHNLALVEDAAQAIGAEDHRRRAGSMGEIGCFSFYPSKNLGAAGDAGMLTTIREPLAARLRRLRVHGGENEYHHDEVGINSRLDAIQAAMLRVKLCYLESWSEARREKATGYTKFFETADLGFELRPPYLRPNSRHIFHQYVVRVPKYRDELIAHLAKHGIAARVYYPVPLHEQKCFSYLCYRLGEFPESESAARETLALPCFPELTATQQDHVMETVSSFQA